MVNVSSNAITNMAITLAIILVGIILLSVSFGMLVKIMRAPQWLIKPFVTIGALIGMYVMFSLFA